MVAAAIPLILAVATVCGCLYLGLAAFAVRRFPPEASPLLSDRPPVTILKPLCGGEPGLYENLRSFVSQDYPAFQVVFGVQAPDDPAIAVVRRLIEDHPRADLKLVVDPTRHGSNLKIANAINMMAAARHDLLVLADSDMRVPPDYLNLVVGGFADRSVGLVTCLYVGAPERGLWSRLGAAAINHGFLPSVLVGRMVGGREGCFGATMALPRSVLAAIGGFEALADRLADDYALGDAVRRIGRKVALAPLVIETRVNEPDLRTLIRHELRWARTIRGIAPVDYAASAITYPVVFALLGVLWSVSTGGFYALSLSVLALALLCRWAMVRSGDRVLDVGPTPFWMLPVRDVLSFGVLVASFCGTRVAWRDRTFAVDADGRMRPDGMDRMGMGPTGMR